MDNSFFILSKQDIKISRFHICTWDIENEDSFVEIGIEFKFSRNEENEAIFIFVAPFLNKKSDISCLAANLIKDSNNSKFIFNDTINIFSAIKGDKRNGAILDFETRDRLQILPIATKSIDTEKKLINIKVGNPKIENDVVSYLRFLIKSDKNTLSTEKKGIAKSSLIYDVKLNEKRNLPDIVYRLTKEDYKLCDVESCFCFHVIPNSFIMSFTDQNKLKNTRELEVPAFREYLPELKSIKENQYIIIFNKDQGKDSYSFFTIFTKETIGTKQILLAIAANILCSLLFAVAYFRQTIIENVSFWKQLPAEYWVSLGVLIILILSLFSPYKLIKKLFKKKKK